jgi:hypothetical protein
MISPIIGKIKSRQMEIGISLAAGNATTWETYQRMVGEHQGLQYVLDAINGMLEDEENKE